MSPLQLALLIISPSTLVASVIAGLGLAMFLRHLGLGWTPSWTFVALLVVGWAFMAMLASSRAILGRPGWEVYIGAALLWLIYAGTASTGLWVMRRHRRGR